MLIKANELNSAPSKERLDSGKTQHMLHVRSPLQVERHIQGKSKINEKDTLWEH